MADRNHHHFSARAGTRVSTIHAFVAELLRDRPVEAGVDPAFAVADDVTASLLLSEAWDRWLEQQREGDRTLNATPSSSGAR
jgi:ATP-dependent exoDNAse (exonuclease V) beta subunit